MKLRPMPSAMIALSMLTATMRPAMAQTPAETPAADTQDSIERLISSEKFDAAAAACTRRIRSDPGDTEALAARAGVYDILHLPALADTDRECILKTPSAAVQPLRDCAAHYFTSARFAETIPYLDFLLRLDPTDLEATERRADCHNALEHFEPAIADFSRALELAHDNDTRAILLYCRAQLRYSHHRLDPSLEDYEAAEMAGLNCTIERADCLARLQRWKESEALYREILRAPADEIYGHGGLRARLDPMPSAHRAGNPEPEGNDETRYNALRGHAVACAHLRLFDTAESDLAEAFALQPGNSYAYGTASWTRLFAGKLQEARTAALKALEIDATQSSALVNLAHTYLLNGHFDWARSIYLSDQREHEEGTRTRIEIVLDDFTELRAAGINDPNIARMEELLRRRAEPTLPAGPP